MYTIKEDSFLKMTSTMNYRSQTLAELKDICRGDLNKYSGFSCLKKNDLVDFMYRRDARMTAVRKRKRRSIIPNLSQMFETEEEKDERIEAYIRERPEEDIVEGMINGLKKDYGDSNISYEENIDESNDLIYKATKKKYVSLHGSLGEHGEMLLFHGTDLKNIKKILSDDFNLTNRPIHGSLYGRGIYFANDIKKAASYSEKNQKTKYILVCNVHVGDICLGSHTMDVHPKMNNNDKTYDTSVDDIDYPKQFVKKKNGTYNILGVITIKDHKNNSSNFSGSFKITNFQKQPLSLYWVPPNLVSGGLSQTQWVSGNIHKFKKMSTILGCKERIQGGLIQRQPSSTKQLCQIGHVFVVVAHYPHDWDPLSRDAVIRIITSQGKNEIIKI